MTTIETESSIATIPPPTVATAIETIPELIDRLVHEALLVPHEAPCTTLYLVLQDDGTITCAGNAATVTGDTMRYHPGWPSAWTEEELRHWVVGALRCSGFLVDRARALELGGDVGLVTVRECPIGQWTILVGSLPWAPAGTGLIPLADLAQSASQRDVALRTWEALGCPATGLITVVPSLDGPHAPAHLFDLEDYALSEGELDDSPVVAYRALTSADSLAALPADSDPIVQRLHLAAAASERAESRRRAAIVALAQYVLGESWASRSDIAAWVRREDSAYPHLRDAEYPTALTDEQRRLMATIAALEVHGVGGPGGYSGDSTARMSWARGLGKGRRQASDGEAWTAAIRSVPTFGYGHPTPAAVIEALPYVRHCDLEWPMAFALAQASAWKECREESTAWCDVARAVYARATAPDAPHTDRGAVALGLRYRVDEAGRAS